MKKLPIKTALYIAMESNYREWLHRLGYSNQTVYMLPNLLREFFWWLEQNNVYTIEALTIELGEQFLDYFSKRRNEKRGGGLSIAHINRQTTALKKFGIYLEKHGGLNFAHGLNYLKNEDTQSRIILSVEEVGDLYAACENTILGLRDRAMLGVYYGCGLRRSEGVNLQVSDVFFDRRLLFVRQSKTRKQRLVPVATKIVQDLEKYIYSARNLLVKKSDEGYLFISERGQKASGQTLIARLKKLALTAGIERAFGFHALRHSVATHLLNSGMELERIGDFLGHSTLDSTQLYTHIEKK